MNEHEPGGESAFEARLRAARPATPEVDPERLNAMIARGSTELRSTQRSPIGDEEKRSGEVIALDQHRSSTPRRSIGLPAAVFGAVAAAVILGVVLLGGSRDTEPLDVAQPGVSTPISDSPVTNDITPVATVTEELRLAWLGVSPDEATPEREAIGGHRLDMSAESIHMIWAELDGDTASVADASFELRRLEVQPDDDPNERTTPSAFADGELRYRGPAARFIDTEITPGTEYVYGVRATVGDEVGPITWRTDVLAVTDTDPPAAVEAAWIVTVGSERSVEWAPDPDEPERLIYVLHEAEGVIESTRIAYTDLPFPLDDAAAGDKIVLIAVDRHGNPSDPVSIPVP